MREHFPLWSFLGWALNAVLELWIIYIWWRNRKRFRLTVLFPAFVIFLLASDVICFIALKFFPGTFAYWHSYWWTQVGETALRALLAIQILSDALFEIRIRILLWSMYFAFCLMAIFALGLPTGMTRVMLRMIIISDLLSAIVLAIAVCWPSIWWHDAKGYSALSFGLLFSMCSDIALFLVRFKTGLVYLPYIRALLPVTGIVTLVLFVVAAMVNTKPNVSLTPKSTTA
ncbi:MAG TPA: hypothetical protein VKU42_05860 [Candidatus Angelobacter sp.]|nr:hypothetical protein [Candidatus Angelobacter sp.]